MKLSEKRITALKKAIIEGADVRTAVQESINDSYTAIADRIYSMNSKVKELADSGNYNDLLVFVGRKFVFAEQPFTAREARRIASYLVKTHSNMEVPENA